MKMLYVSVTLMLALLGATAYLAMQARDEAVKANVKMDLFTQQQRAVAAQNAAAQEAQVQLPPETKSEPAPVVTATTPKTSAPAGSATTVPAVPKSAPAGSPSLGDVPAPIEAPLTPAQRLVKEAPFIAKVKEFVADQGFVVLSSGSKQGLQEGQKFDVRRDASVVGRIRVSSVDETESVADLDTKSVPSGVTVRAGDEIIGLVTAR